MVNSNVDGCTKHYITIKKQTSTENQNNTKTKVKA